MASAVSVTMTTNSLHSHNSNPRKDFASRGSQGTKRPNVLRLRVAFNERQWVYRVKSFASRGVIAVRSERVSVYVLRSESDSGFYIGFSTDLKRRLSEHKRGASFATKSRGPWKLIYYEAYREREDAEGREKFLKSGAHPVRSIPARSIAPLSPRKRLCLTRLRS